MNESFNSLNDGPRTPAGASEGLVFPDWSGQVAAQPRMPADAWLAYCRLNLSRLRQRPGHAERRRQNGVSAEFSL
jgi:hypothetical protein